MLFIIWCLRLAVNILREAEMANHMLVLFLPTLKYLSQAENHGDESLQGDASKNSIGELLDPVPWPRSVHENNLLAFIFLLFQWIHGTRFWVDRC